MDDSTLWTYEDVAEYLQMSWRTVRKWKNEGKIPHVKVGSRCRFVPAKIKAWAAKNGAKKS